MFSVVIPAYNCEKTIEKVLSSVLNQTRFDLIEEIIIVNDGSTDNTKNIVKAYINEHAYANIILLNQENSGVSCARNEGIRASKGKWIALLDSDDIWLERKIELQADEIKRNEKIKFLGIAYPLRIYNRKYYEGLYKLDAKQLCFRNTPDTSSIVFERKSGIDLGLFDEKMKYGEDINFFQRFITIDSYYVLAADLMEKSIGKPFFAAEGLSSNLKAMHLGRNKNTEDLYRMGLISYLYLCIMLSFNQIKYFRRKIQKKINSVIYLIKKKNL